MIMCLSKKLKADGFTIVETMIVLAIGGLILLIIFIAIPSLERSSRNNERKQDVTVILQAISHYELSNSGNFPGDCSTASSPCQNNINDGFNDNFLQYNYNALTYYGAGNSAAQVDLTGYPSTPAPATPVTDINKVEIFDFMKCNLSSPGNVTTTGADYSNVVALYAFETSGVPQCQQLE
jgi:prepilin-type N-terminal cleavage/methylation domain-containing protein